MYMQHLKPFVEKVCSPDDFEDVKNNVSQVLFNLLLISQRCKYYNSPTRITSMINALSDEVISQAREYIQANELFTIEPEEAIEKLRIILKVLHGFHESFNFAKVKSAQYPRPWTFDSKFALESFENFHSRVEKLMYVLESLIEFNKIEKIEIGNSRV